MKRLWVLAVAAAVLLAGCAKEEGGRDDLPTNTGGTVAVDAADDWLLAETAVTDHGELAFRPYGDVVEINEKIFIAQTNDIYLNYEDYMGKLIKYEGMYKSYQWPEEEKVYHYVIRYGPGCCGNDGDAGFEVIWDGEYPEEDDWVEATGTLELYDVGGWTFLQLRLTALNVLDERGMEYVSQ